LAEEGIGIIFVSSELPEVLNVPVRVLVLSRGKVTGYYERSEISEERLVLAAGVQHQAEVKVEPTLNTN
jgi:ABC-type sugar transport system ATPase subunit